MPLTSVRRWPQPCPHRRLGIVEDETWKDGMRLVCMDAVSNVILFERTSEERSAAASGT
ncbi:MAG: hypothetical protein ACLFQ1_09810 [Halochromatium sp.]|uniref:hypothetical protein n=1 Tax=Halochromatium sp. TaxID=2049430 RepID=UPI00397D2585